MIEILTVLGVLGIYFCGVLGFPFAVRYIRPINIFVKDISSGDSYEDYKECVTMLSMFWIIMLIAIGAQHLWKWLSNVSLKNSGYQPKKVDPPHQLREPKYVLRSGQGWTIGNYKQALNALRKQIEDMAVRVEQLEVQTNHVRLTGDK